MIETTRAHICTCTNHGMVSKYILNVLKCLTKLFCFHSRMMKGKWFKKHFNANMCLIGCWISLWDCYFVYCIPFLLSTCVIIIHRNIFVRNNFSITLNSSTITLLQLSFWWKKIYYQYDKHQYWLYTICPTCIDSYI